MIVLYLNYLYSYFFPIVFAVLLIHLWRKKQESAFLWLAVGLGIVPLWLSFHRIVQFWFIRSYIPIGSGTTAAVTPAPVSPPQEILLILSYSYMMLSVFAFGCLVMALWHFGNRSLDEENSSLEESQANEGGLQ